MQAHEPSSDLIRDSRTEYSNLTRRLRVSQTNANELWEILDITGGNISTRAPVIFKLLYLHHLHLCAVP